MTINQAALDLIKNAEGWRATAYPDPGTGGEPLTIGFGHTSSAGPPVVTHGMVITTAQGEAILQQDLAGTEATVRSYVKVPLNDNEFGALVSFVFNVGGGNFVSSTLLRKLNAGDKIGAAVEFGRWNHAGGNVLPGLTTRRAAERDLFLTHVDAPPAPAPVPVPTPVSTPTPTPAQPPIPAAPSNQWSLPMNLSWLTIILNFLPSLMALEQDIAAEVKLLASNADGQTKLNQTVVILEDLLARIKAATSGTTPPPALPGA